MKRQWRAVSWLRLSMCFGLGRAMLSCREAPDFGNEGGARVEPVFSQHAPVPVGEPFLKLGDDCSQNGESSCESRVCLHARASEKDKGHVCSRACSSTAECPKDWTCVETYPGPNA
jgi:hypothetical protein